MFEYKIGDYRVKEAEQKMNEINDKFNPTQKACIDNVDVFASLIKIVFPI